jgi:hypothetical protein
VAQYEPAQQNEPSESGYASGNLREVYFYPKQLEGHMQRYHPGQ